jgi:preprotein translocase subunit SecG
MMTFIYFLAIALFLLICVLLCFVILIQESKSTGLGASFGGETTDSLFGTSTADVLKKFTAWLAAIFLASCVVLSLWTASLGRSKASNNAPAFTMEHLE